MRVWIDGPNSEICDAIRSNRIGSFANCEISGCSIRRLQQIFLCLSACCTTVRSATVANRCRFVCLAKIYIGPTLPIRDRSHQCACHDVSILWCEDFREETGGIGVAAGWDAREDDG